MGFAAEKLSDAAYELVVRPGDIRSRLYFASEFIFRTPRAGVPPSLVKIFDEVRERLTRKKVPEEAREFRSTASVNLHRMRDTTGSALAAKIHRLSSEIDALFRERKR